MPSARSSRQPTISLTPVVFAASRARTMPASELRSATPRASMPQAAAWANSSSQEEAPPQEGEMRRDLQFGVAGAHPKIPCRNQRCDPVSGSSPSPARYIQKRSPASSSTRK